MRADPHRAQQTTGEGTPEVTEFAAATFGARMGRGTHAGRRHTAAALDLKLRLPLLWSRVQALEVRDTYAIHVAEATRSLSAAEAAWVDGEVAESADGRIPWTRFQTLVAGKVTAAAPHLAREREERAARARFAKVLNPVPGDQAAGMATVRAPVPVITALGHDRHRSRRPGQPRPGQPGPGPPPPGRPYPGGPDLDLGDLDLRGLLPRTSLVVHLYGGTVHAHPGPDSDSDSDSGSGSSTGRQATVAAARDVDEHGHPIDRVARIEGHGPVTETWLRDVLGHFAHVEVLPVLDIDGLAPVDAYEIPTRHRRAVQLRHPVETFPWGHASSTTSHTQIDHQIPWAREPGGGQTAVDNLAPLSTWHHRLKTHGGWQVREPFPGIHLWRDPHGQTYVRDASGTRPVPADPAPPTPERTPEQSTLVVEIYPARPVQLAGDLAHARWRSDAA